MADLVCAKCGAPMILRTAKSGTGRQFWGCSAFPKCFGKKGVAPGERVSDTVVVESRPATPEEAQVVADTPMRKTLEFIGVHADFLADATPEIDLEGSLSCGKTTVALWKELLAMEKHPGIWVLIARWVDDQVKTLLRPALEQLARIHGTVLKWNDKFSYYETDNGSRAYMFGLKTISSEPEQRYGKIRGLAVSRIYIDQAEQLPADIAGELRLRLRPDIEARMRGVDYPRQLTFSPNPTNFDHWLSKQFPESNKIKGRRYYSLSLFDNAHNLPAEMIDGALAMYPPEHPKHQTVILGKRGLNVVGDAVYDAQFNRKLHIKTTEWLRDVPLIEAFQLGKHNPVWVIAQRTPQGSLRLHGGLLGERLMVEDFVPKVKLLRQEWFPGRNEQSREGRILTCSSPMGGEETAARFTLMNILREHKFRPLTLEHANAHDVQLGMIEEIAKMLRQRVTSFDEALEINAEPDHWLSMAADGTVKERPFMAFAFEGGYVWDAHDVSTANKEMRQPFVDDEYSSAMRCVENLVLHFCAGQASADDRETARARQRAKERQAEPRFTGGKTGWMA